MEQHYFVFPPTFKEINVHWRKAPFHGQINVFYLHLKRFWECLIN
jgi:hypothetical protein